MTVKGSFAVVVPVYRAHLSDDEKLAFQHLEHFLPEAEKILVMPETLDFGRDGYGEARFAPAFFKDIAGYSRLLLSRDFYARFEEREYILVHQLDSIILSSDIERFLAFGVDYLGAPWVRYDGNGVPYFTKVGNGGLSLRRVSALRRLVESRVPHTTPREYYRRHDSRALLGRRPIALCKAGLMGLGMRNSIRGTVARCLGKEDWYDFAAEARSYSLIDHEDGFIATEAQNFVPGFTIGSVAQALEFAFEMEPRFCYEKAGGRMPLGAHAWGRYDRAFWEPHLLS
jgi:hypothetical protein